MPDHKAPPQIFDRDLLRMRRTRAQKRDNGSFVLDRCVEDAAERLQDINRRFDNALIIAPVSFSENLLTRLPADKRPGQIVRAYYSEPHPDLDMTIDDEVLPFAPQDFDLVISILNLHSVNDLPGTLVQIRQSLKPDGLFIGCMFGGDTLTELRRALYAADEKILGGLTPRVFPLPDYSQAATLLQRTGFALPVVDTDRFSVNYRKLGRLIGDIRDLGESNILQSRSNTVLTKGYMRDLEKNYRDSFTNISSKLTASFEILWMTGWAPHESQQKPLKPGSAKMRLADALKRRD